MEESNAVWYLPGQDNQPKGPYTTEQLLEQFRTGQLDGATLCWRKGMPDWKPLAEVEPFNEVVPIEAAGRTDVSDKAKRAIQGIGNVFGRAVSATKKKAKTTSLKLSINQHQKRKHQILFELGNALYERDSDSEMLSQSPYVEKIQQARAEDESIQQIRQQIEAMENVQEAKPQSEDS